MSMSMSMSMMMISLMQEVSTSVLLIDQFAIKASLDQNTVARQQKGKIGTV